MKTTKHTLLAAILLLSAIATAPAQTNITDAQGYVTNSAFLNSFQVTNTDGAVSNAVMVKVLPNKFFYKTPDGAERVGYWSFVSTNVQAEFGYNASNAAVADSIETLKKVNESLAAAAQANLIRQQKIGDAAIAAAEKSKMDLYGSVIQILPEGMLVMLDDWMGGQVVIIEDCQTTGKADGDHIEAHAYPIGTFSYTTTQDAQKTVHAFTLDLDRAAKFNLSGGN